MGQHLIRFQGFNYSGSVNQNLLWNDRNIYLMDNHRAALWCWQQQLNLRLDDHCILHIDRHTDCLQANLDAHIQALPDLSTLSIQQYLDQEVMLSQSAKLFRWDNYLSIHLAVSHKRVKLLRSVDHNDGDKPNFEPTIRPSPDETPENISYWLESKCFPWIVNVDLDYFFCRDSDDVQTDDERWIPMFSDSYIESVFCAIRRGLDSKQIAVLTLCLTPTDFTPGWKQCLNLSEKIFDILGASHPKLCV